MSDQALDTDGLVREINRLRDEMSELRTSLEAAKAELAQRESELERASYEADVAESHSKALEIERDLLLKRVELGEKESANLRDELNKVNFSHAVRGQLLTEAEARLAAAEEALKAKDAALLMAKQYLLNDLVEPGRTVFWAVADALRIVRKSPPQKIGAGKSCPHSDSDWCEECRKLSGEPPAQEEPTK